MNQAADQATSAELDSRFDLQATRGQWLLGIVIVVITCATYFPVTQSGFIWDDDAYVINNRSLRTLDGLKDIWFDVTATPQYYPLVHSTFWIEYQLWQLDPLGYHLTNVTFHILSALVLWRICALLKVPGAWFIALIFAIHPVHVESVAWVTERKNTMSAFFYLAAAFCFLKAYLGSVSSGDQNDQSQNRSLVSTISFAAIGLFICAMLSKTVAATLPAALLLIIYWKNGVIRIRDWILVAPMFLIGVPMGLATAWLEKHHVGAMGAEWDFSAIDRVLIAGRAVCFYASKIVVPNEQIFIYPRWQIDSNSTLQYLFPALAIGGILVSFFLRNKIGRGPVVCLLFFVGTLFPALGFLDVYPMRYSYVADHFQYVASIGIIAIVIGSVWHVARQKSEDVRQYTIIFGFVAVAVCGWLTWSQIGDYKNVETLWRNTLLKNPDCWMAHNNLGEFHLNPANGKSSKVKAEKHFRRAVKINPNAVEVLNNLGSFLAEDQRTNEAREYLEKALAIDETFAAAHFNLGVVCQKEKRIADAKDHYEKAIELDSGYGSAYYNLASLFIAERQLDKAANALQSVIALKPKVILSESDGRPFALAHNNLGSIMKDQKQLDEAAEHFYQAIELSPNLADPYFNLAAVLQLQGMEQSSREYLQKAIKIKRGSSDR